MNLKNKLIRYIGVLLFAFTIVGFTAAVPVFAASAEVSVTIDEEEVTVGDVIYVNIRIESLEQLGDFEAFVTYDDSVLEYRGNSAVITGSSGFLKLSDTYVTESSTSRKYTLEFDALKVGSCEISFNDLMVFDESGMEMSTSHNVLTVNVTAPVTYSTNAFLGSLKTSPYELAPSFYKNVFEYNVNVDYKTEQLFLTALPEDLKASVSISGNDFLKEGENKVIIKVLAQSGDIIEYTINVYREMAPLEDEGEDKDDVPQSTHSMFEIAELSGKKYAIFSGRYQLVEPGDAVQVPKGFVETGMMISGVAITAYYPEGDMGSDFLLIYALNEETGELGFYRYDKKEKTMQRYVTKDTPIYDDKAVDDLKEYMTSQQYQSNLNKVYVVIALLCILCGILTFTVIRMFLRIKGLKEDELD